MDQRPMLTRDRPDCVNAAAFLDCTVFDIIPVAKLVLDVAVGVTCLNRETRDFIICMSDQ